MIIEGTVKCDGCGEAIRDSGTMCLRSDVDIEVHTQAEDGQMLHFHDECSIASADQEFRICMQCGKPMIDGMTNLENVYTHEECFEKWMGDNCPGGWRETEDDGLDGYYEELVGGKWVGTGIFYTEWY